MDTKKPQIIRKRKSIDNTADPYLMPEVVNGRAVCKKCHAVFTNKRWTLDEKLYDKKIDEKGTHSLLLTSHFLLLTSFK